MNNQTAISQPARNKDLFTALPVASAMKIQTEHVASTASESVSVVPKTFLCRESRDIDCTAPYRVALSLISNWIESSPDLDQRAKRPKKAGHGKKKKLPCPLKGEEGTFGKEREEKGRGEEGRGTQRMIGGMDR